LPKWTQLVYTKVGLVAVGLKIGPGFRVVKSVTRARYGIRYWTDASAMHNMETREENSSGFPVGRASFNQSLVYCVTRSTKAHHTPLQSGPLEPNGQNRKYPDG
jgi:hypothetical protein